MSAISSVTFFGSAESLPESENYQKAYETAKFVASSGREVVNGGGPGTMLAATLGAKAAQGKSVVVYYTPKYATSFEGKSAENYADEVYEEANYIMRTKKLIELGNIYVIFYGGTGTLSEFAMAWEMARLYFGHHKPVILVGALWKEIVDVLKKDTLIPAGAIDILTVVETPEEVLREIDKYEVMLKLNKHTHECKGDECFFIL
ncbi:MAG: LOG family protein [Candidatus Roizmanbacteria bacterium]